MKEKVKKKMFCTNLSKKKKWGKKYVKRKEKKKEKQSKELSGYKNVHCPNKLRKINRRSFMAHNLKYCIAWLFKGNIVNFFHCFNESNRGEFLMKINMVNKEKQWVKINCTYCHLESVSLCWYLSNNDWRKENTPSIPGESSGCVDFCSFLMRNRERETLNDVMNENWIELKILYCLWWPNKEQWW